jgi:hypothetical protein
MLGIFYSDLKEENLILAPTANDPNAY